MSGVTLQWFSSATRRASIINPAWAVNRLIWLTELNRRRTAGLVNHWAESQQRERSDRWTCDPTFNQNVKRLWIGLRPSDAQTPEYSCDNPILTFITSPHTHTHTSVTGHKVKNWSRTSEGQRRSGSAAADSMNDWSDRDVHNKPTEINQQTLEEDLVYLHSLKDWKNYNL